MLAKNEQFHVLLLPSVDRVQAPGSWMGGVPYIRFKLGGGPTLQASVLSTT